MHVHLYYMWYIYVYSANIKFVDANITGFYIGTGLGRLGALLMWNDLIE